MVNRRTPKTETGRRWYGIALSGLTNALAKVTGRILDVSEFCRKISAGAVIRLK